MSALNAVMDTYDRRARFYPMVIVLLPAIVGGACWLPGNLELPSMVGGTLITLAVSAFLTQLARDQGKRREKELFRRWGGRPSDRALSYAGRVFADATLARCHKKLVALDAALAFPESRTAEQESAKEARAAYAAGTDLLVAKTRERERFPLLFKENISYGFRRNLWGMKAAGVLTSALGTVACFGKVVAFMMVDQPVGAVPVIGGSLCAVLLSVWCALVTPEWVRVPADGYAKHLVEACESL